MFLRQLEPRTARTTGEVLNFALWPVAILTVIHRVFINAVNYHVTNDFTPVYNASLAFLNHRAVYDANFNSTDPAYLYPPSGTLLISPLAIIDPEKSRWCFILVNALALLLAWYLLLKLFNFTINSVAAPALLLGMFVSETVTNTLAFTNINGCLFLAMMVFIHLLLKRQDLWAGVALGLTIAVKGPLLVPLLLIPLVRGQWKVFITALGVPIALNLIAWPLIVDYKQFFTHTLPYLMEARDYFNSAIVGNAGYYGVAEWLTWIIRIVMGILVLISLWILYRYYREDEVFYICNTSGILITAVMLLGSLGQMYYSMFLFPMLLTVVQRNSLLRNWPAWLAIFGFMSYDKWLSDRWQSIGRDLEYLRTTFGWGLLLIVVFCVLGDRYLAAKREGRLEVGKSLDPAWMHPEWATEPAEAADATPAPRTKAAASY
ncbi:glycosyltransferase family 87 protein [Nocardia sp. CDC153]|uniref:glycosyltransferase family 87 protein n=1 Tax=Nocardia sp. CDC153 TaxID=3112167 RepID=UPI002DB70957|nr:glycosyltransferase family 87 protein [Nocardia sp. CDC153]MEC3953847.1 glycosyltransferase family 87 protein [Nocardia sp. CDC153]